MTDSTKRGLAVLRFRGPTFDPLPFSADVPMPMHLACFARGRGGGNAILGCHVVVAPQRAAACCLLLAIAASVAVRRCASSSASAKKFTKHEGARVSRIALALSAVSYYLHIYTLYYDVIFSPSVAIVALYYNI
jgi:hypothetical protein